MYSANKVAFAAAVLTMKQIQAIELQQFGGSSGPSWNNWSDAELNQMMLDTAQSQPEVQNLVNEAMSAGEKFKKENQQLIDSYGVDE